MSVRTGAAVLQRSLLKVATPGPSNLYEANTIDVVSRESLNSVSFHIKFMNTGAGTTVTAHIVERNHPSFQTGDFSVLGPSTRILHNFPVGATTTSPVEVFATSKMTITSGQVLIMWAGTANTVTAMICGESHIG